MVIKDCIIFFPNDYIRSSDLATAIFNPSTDLIPLYCTTLSHTNRLFVNYLSSCFNYLYCAVSHTEKYFFNLVKSTRNQIVFTIFRMIWIQINWNMVKIIYFQIDLIRFRKYFSVCNYPGCKNYKAHSCPRDWYISVS